MKEISIEDLAYHLKQASDRGLPKPIFFLGAGASFSGRIPLASGIETIIKENYADNPEILKLADDDKTYSKLMACLSPIQRNELLSSLIADAKINVTHIYLAQLIKKNLVDYVLTANFDNLMLRALALFDIFPPVYDLTSISDFTTTTIKDKSVVYLHGQHNGNWLLNTDEEMAKVKAIVPRIFDTIKNQRPWIFLGYSGNDPIFEHIKNLGRFDNGLYWVGHDNYLPSKLVQDFLNKPNTNAHFIKGYDADAFMLKLNNALGLEQPDILDKPFSSLKTMLSNIVDIDDEDHFRGAKARLEIARKNVNYSIQFFEDTRDIKLDKREQNIDKLKKDIIDLIISEEYDGDRISTIELLAKEYDDQGVNYLLAELYFYLGTKYSRLLEKCNNDNKEQFLNITIENYSKSIKYLPYSYESLYNCGVSLSALAEIKTGIEAECLYEQAIDKYRRAIEIDSNKSEALNNWGASLSGLAAKKKGKEAQRFYQQAFRKYKQAIEVNPSENGAFNNWGTSLAALAKTKTGLEAEHLYQQANEKYYKAIEIDPSWGNTYYNWGLSLAKLAAIKTGTEAECLYQQANEKYNHAFELNPEEYKIAYSWASSLLELANIMSGEIANELYEESFEKFQQASDFNPDIVDIFSDWGVGLSRQAATKTGMEAEYLYQQAFEKYKQAIKLKPSQETVFYNWGVTLATIAATKTGIEAENLYQQANEKYCKAIELDPLNQNIFNNWGASLSELGKIRTGTEAQCFFQQANEKYLKAIELDPNKYEAIYNFGSNLLYLAQTEVGIKAEKLYLQALDQYNYALNIMPNMMEALINSSEILILLARVNKGVEADKFYKQACVKLKRVYQNNGKCYNLACCYALTNRDKDALKYLRLSLGNKEVTAEHVLAEEEWQKYLKNSYFKTIIEKNYSL